MIQKLNIKDTKTAKNVLEVQIASYKIEAELIGLHEIPPLKDTIDSLRECDEFLYGYYIKNVLVGIISFKIIENILDVHRVAVHPRFFRMGIGGKLVNFVEGIEDNINKIVVCTGKENLPAINLYFKKGYQKKKDIEISKGIYLTELEKKL